MTNPQFTPKPADTADLKHGEAGAGKAIDQTWDREKRQTQGGKIDDPTDEAGSEDGGGRSERDPLPHHRDLPGQEIPDQDPDLEPTIGDDEDAEPDTFPTDEQQRGRSIPL